MNRRNIHSELYTLSSGWNNPTCYRWRRTNGSS